MASDRQATPSDDVAVVALLPDQARALYWIQKLKTLHHSLCKEFEGVEYAYTDTLLLCRYIRLVGYDQRLCPLYEVTPAGEQQLRLTSP